ncbi:MAG: DUF4230 domain-containing protein [Selenomonadaceae bacterium]|nr:DUF4230 domain-containing protein [Selenomonadaceae bacterium]
MFEVFGATFGVTLAGGLVLGAMTFAAGILFMKYRKLKDRQILFEQVKSIVREEIRDVCELALVRENFKSVVSVDVDKKLPFFDVHIPGTSRKFLMDYSGTIVCGFDLSGVQISRDGALSNKVKIILPPSKILDIYADVNSFNVHLQDAGLLASNIKIEEQNAWVAADVAEHGQRAVKEGLLLRADDNARKLLLSKIESRGLNGKFEFEILTLNAENVRQINPPQ